MFEKCIYFNLNALVRDLNKIWEPHFEELNLSPPLGYMFTAVLSEPGLSQKELAAHLHLERSTVTRFLDTLEKKGLIKREASPEDARVVHIYASEKGRALKAKVARAMKKVSEALDGRIADQDIETLLSTAGKVRENLKT